MKRISRRRFLAGSSVGIALVAGCAGQGGDSGGGSTASNAQTPTRTATQTPTRTTTGQHDHEGNHSNGTEGTNGSEHEGTHSEEGDGHHSSEMPSAPKGTANVTMATESGQQHFEPHVVWIEPGGTVTWTLESGAHSTTAYHPNNSKPLRIPEGASAWNSEVLSEQGATFERTFETEGVFDYFCIPHESLGMIGSVIVGRPEPSGQPALEPPQEELSEQARAKIKQLNEMERKILK